MEVNVYSLNRVVYLLAFVGSDEELKELFPEEIAKIVKLAKQNDVFNEAMRFILTELLCFGRLPNSEVLKNYITTVAQAKRNRRI